jgi:uncharacterized protein (TIGR03083 family)
MTDQITTADVAALIRATSTRLELLLAQLSVEQINQPGAVGVWSVKDVLAHLAFWERYCVRMLRAVARGETPEMDADDATERSNASVVAQYYQRPLSGVVADWQQAREDLLEQLERLADDDLHDPDRFPWSAGRTLLERIAGNSYEHEQEHIDQIRAWMAENR